MVLPSGQISHAFLRATQSWMAWPSGYTQTITDTITYKDVNANCKIKRTI